MTPCGSYQFQANTVLDSSGGQAEGEPLERPLTTSVSSIIIQTDRRCRDRLDARQEAAEGGIRPRIDAAVFNQTGTDRACA